ncbi:MAG: hypothetical protein FIA92_00590 [Chloroflexi bacterium]|nr:hypothetical protein [Chloroflexota bacterium]
MNDQPKPIGGEAHPVGETAEGVRMYGWQWTTEDDRGPRLPWIGIFLVVLGGLLLLDRVLPEYRSLGNVVVLAAGLAFLVLWLINRGTLSLYAGAFLTAAAIPGLLEGLGVIAGPGLGTLAFGVALVFIAVVRLAGGGGLGWQMLLGVILVALGGSQLALPDLAGLILPLLLVALGIVLVTRGRR